MSRLIKNPTFEAVESLIGQQDMKIARLEKDKAELVEALDDAVGLCQIAEHAWEHEDDALLLNCQALAAKHRS